MLKLNFLINKIKYNRVKITIFAIFILFMVIFLLPNFCLAAVNVGAEYADKIGLGKDDPRVIAARIVQIALGFIGIVTVGIIIYGGWLWMTSGGNEEKILVAKRVLKNAIIGLIIILSAFAIVSFIISKLLSESVSSPGPPGPPGTPGGLGALGACSLESVYPEPGQTNPEVPRNTIIIVTFKEEIDLKTICGKDICDGDDNIVSDNIKIFHTNERDVCLEDGPCNSQVTEVNVITKDKKTFVFMPINYLGSASEYIWYSVYLSNDILKKDGQPVFKNCRTDYFEWNFEISNKIDLTPPQVKLGGVFPAPDNEMDEVSTTTPAQQARGSIVVKNNPNIYQSAVVGAVIPQGGSESAAVSGTYNCQADGTITVSISAGTPNTANVGGITGLVSGDDVSDNIASLGCGLTLAPTDGSFAIGNSWTIGVSAEKQSDTLTVGNTVYTFVSGTPSGNQIQQGITVNNTAINIQTAIGSAGSPIHPDVFTLATGNIVAITARAANSASNNIALTSSSLYNSASNTGGAFEIKAMSGGVDIETTTKVNGREDKSRNAIIQANFNEAIMPITVSGEAEDIKDYIRVICVSGNCSGDDFFQCNGEACLKGKFMISNIYRTVEFISDNKCGVNACGEDIYCLPENSNLKMELVAANLDACASDNDCSTRTPFNTCHTVCQNSNGTNYPLASLPLDGIMDAALNSLDGNRDFDADGPVSFYNENSPDSSFGDNYKWSFFINDKIYLTPPVITSTGPAHNSAGVSLSEPVEIDFNNNAKPELMMSSSLKTGSTYIFNGQENILHQLLNIWNFTSDPLGYWIAKENIDNAPPDGEADWTKVYIRHSLFSDATSYRTQAGSGVKDIYQNCFKPSAGPACFGANDYLPSCCSGTLTPDSSCP